MMFMRNLGSFVYSVGLQIKAIIWNMTKWVKLYLIRALQPTQVSCFFANFIIPLFEGVDIEIDLV